MSARKDLSGEDERKESMRKLLSPDLIKGISDRAYSALLTTFIGNSGDLRACGTLAVYLNSIFAENYESTHQNQLGDSELRKGLAKLTTQLKGYDVHVPIAVLAEFRRNFKHATLPVIASPSIERELFQGGDNYRQSLSEARYEDAHRLFEEDSVS